MISVCTRAPSSGTAESSAPNEAICEAVARPNMRFVPIKTVVQQALLAVHRVRQAFVSARTAQSNQLRGLLTEFGIVMPKETAVLEKRMSPNVWLQSLP